MNRLLTTIGFATLSGAALSQTFTTSGVSGAGVTATGISVSGVVDGALVSGSATYTLAGLATGFNRYDIRAVSNRSIGAYTLGLGNQFADGPPFASTTVPGISARVLTGAGTAASASNTDWYIGQNGSTFALAASAKRDLGTASASVAIAAAQAPLATSSALSGSVATAGSPTGLGSTSSLWIFHFPGDPATGTATINLSSATSTFARALNSLGGTSGHRDNVRLEVKTFLDGVQVGSTAISAANTSLAPGVGTANQNIVFSSVPSVTLNPANIYGTTKSLTVVTSLIGTAFSGNGTSLGDYTIASSTFSGVNVQGVPEPASIAGLSLGLLAFARRRKSK
jgi:hypothetical protein